MSSNPTQIVHQLRQDFQELIEFVTDAESKTRTAYEVELALFRSLLALGADLLRLFFVQRAAKRPEEPIYEPDGTTISYHGMRPTTYFSVFDKIQFRRLATVLSRKSRGAFLNLATRHFYKKGVDQPLPSE